MKTQTDEQSKGGKAKFWKVFLATFGICFIGLLILVAAFNPMPASNKKAKESLTTITTVVQNTGVEGQAGATTAQGLWIVVNAGINLVVAILPIMVGGMIIGCVLGILSSFVEGYRY